MRLTKSEMEIMNVLWKAGRPLTRGEILELSTDKTWQDNSIHILLNGMLKKDAIRPSGFVRSGKVWARQYEPNISIEDYFAENVFSHASLKEYPLLFSAMINKDEITPALLNEFEEMIQKRRQELE